MGTGPEGSPWRRKPWLRNVTPVKLAKASDVNAEELLAFDKIVVTSKGLKQLAARIKP